MRNISIALSLLLAVVAHARSIHEPPRPDQAALMARFIVNEANYTSMGTVSIRDDIKEYPYVSLLSLSDGPVGKGSGVPYVFLTALDYSGQDLPKNNKVTLMMSLVQNGWCSYKNYDPMDPRCPRVTLAGKITKLTKENPEYETAKAAVIGRHPWLARTPEDHHFYFGKLEIETIDLYAKFGGPAHITPTEYYNVNMA